MKHKAETMQSFSRLHSKLKIMVKCLACGRAATREQPAYCTFCFIPLSGSKEIKGDKKLLQIRKENRKVFAQEMITGSKAAEEFKLALGLEHLNTYDLAASLSSIGQEKLHPMSSEYSWSEAQTYLDLAYALAEQLGVDRLQRITAQRLAEQLIRGGWADEVPSILGTPLDLGQKLEVYEETEELVRAFSNLESYALLQLSRAVLGEHWDKEKIKKAILHFWELMRPGITEQIVHGAKSFLQGTGNQRHPVPRFDKLAFVQSLVVHAEIASSKSHFSDDAVEALQVFGRMLIILGEMSPKDDPLFYGSVVREYIRLFNGMFWHRRALYENDADLVQSTIVQAHSIIVQWGQLIPPQSWMETRPSRFIEIFFRATRWAEQLSPRIFLDRWIKVAPSEVRPYIKYFEAEALLNNGQNDECDQILLTLGDSEKTDTVLQEAIQNLLQRSTLDKVGLVLGIEHKSFLSVLEVILEVPTGGNISEYTKLSELMDITLPDPDTLMRLDFKPVMEWLGRQVAIRGEVFDDLIYRTPEVAGQYLNQNIIIAGDSYYRDVHWKSPFSAFEKPVNGLRTDVVVLRLSFERDILSLLFEAEMLDIEEMNDQVFINPPELYHLQGVAWTSHPPEDLFDAIISLFNGTSLHRQLDIYTLKIDLT